MNAFFIGAAIQCSLRCHCVCTVLKRRVHGACTELSFYYNDLTELSRRSLNSRCASPASTGVYMKLKMNKICSVRVFNTPSLP